MGYFQRISEHNKLSLNKPLNTDMVYYSELNEWFTNNAFRSLSLKFVVNQNIFYKIDNYEYRVDANQYMIACTQSDVKAYFESDDPVRSICIDLCPDSFSEAYAVLTSKHDDIDKYLEGYFKYPEFYEKINPVQNDSLSEKLLLLLENIEGAEDPKLNKEWFLDLVEKIIQKEYGTYLTLKNIYSVKLSTRKEIFRRLELAKEYMNSDFLRINEIRQVAEQCHMSEYHFFRSFKQAFGMTPFQYITHKKMDIALSLLRDTQLNLTDVAYSCNYPDASTFSKAFKRHFGYSPTLYRRETANKQILT